MKYKAKDSIRNFCNVNEIVEDITDSDQVSFTLGNKTDRVLQNKTNQIILSPLRITELFDEVEDAIETGEKPEGSLLEH